MKIYIQEKTKTRKWAREFHLRPVREFLFSDCEKNRRKRGLASSKNSKTLQDQY